MRLNKYHGNPVLAPIKQNSWESLVATNPGVWHDENSGITHMLYRAAGHDLGHKIHLGYAISKDGYNFNRVENKPVFSPVEDHFDGGTVEDPRLIKVGEYYYITYATSIFPIGQYWKYEKKDVKWPSVPEWFPAQYQKKSTSTALAITKDFRTFLRAGRMTKPNEDDRDVVIFPEKINGKFCVIHRPMHRVGKQYGTDKPAVWIYFTDDLLTQEKSTILMKPQFEWEYHKIGANTPPIKTQQGWLMIYHAVSEDRYYRLGAVLMDLQNPARVTHRTRDFILEPEFDYETKGCYGYGGVVFPCGCCVRDGVFFLYYGAADKYVAIATCPLSDLIDYLLSCKI
jgi:predicted GH43/DUF377 family glycosyl hydrolase